MPRDRDLLGNLVDEAEELATRMSNDEVARHLEERAHGMEPGSPGRAELLSLAGERWELADQLTRARDCFDEAVADGGACFLEPRVELANTLFTLGEDARAEALVAELEQVARRSSGGDSLHEQVGEVLETHGRLEEALRWYDSGLDRLQRHDPGVVDVGCLRGHYRVRRAMGLPLDRLDVESEEQRQVDLAQLAGHRHAGASAEEERPVLAVLYWPEAEFERLLEAWPSVAEGYGMTHVEHRRLVERHLRELADARGRVRLATAAFDDYVAFAAERDHESGDSSTRAMYAAHLAHLGRSTDWPPGRNAACWCGSQRKYKKCCGAPSFLTG